LTTTVAAPQQATPTRVEPIERLPFAYRALSRDGEPVSGSVEAADLEDAQRLLRAMGLRALEVSPAEASAAPRRAGGALRGEDFLTFNQQLAHLTRAGLPVEHGLRLIAQDMRRGRLSTTVKLVAAELERGTPLPQAFDKYRRQFPPLYARLVDAGIRSNNLSGMLLNLGRHVEMTQRLRAALWRASAYPLMVMLALVAILLVISLFVLPQIADLYDNLLRQRIIGIGRTRWGGPAPDLSLPLITRALINVGEVLPTILVVIACVLIAFPLLVALLRHTRFGRGFADALLLPLPLIGPVLKRNLVARWVDALRIGVVAGMDLPGAIEVANDAVASPRLRRDGNVLLGVLQSGGRLTAPPQPLWLLPPAVAAAIERASQTGDLPGTLEVLTQMYQQQAEMRLRMVPLVATPLLLLIVAASIGFVMAALLLPIFRLIQAIGL
jgi:type IV pilus assembly protein PilC